MVINFDFRHVAKKSKFMTTCCKFMANYISIYLDIFYEKLVSDGLQLARSKKYSLMICIGIFLAFGMNKSQRRNPLKKCFFQKMWFLVDLGFPSVILVKKPLRAMCLSFKMVYQHLLYLLSLWTYWHLKITQGPTHFFNGNFRGC